MKVECAPIGSLGERQCYNPRAPAGRPTGFRLCHIGRSLRVRCTVSEDDAPEQQRVSSTEERKCLRAGSGGEDAPRHLFVAGSPTNLVRNLRKGKMTAA